MVLYDKDIPPRTLSQYKTSRFRWNDFVGQFEDDEGIMNKFVDADGSIAAHFNNTVTAFFKHLDESKDTTKSIVCNAISFIAYELNKQVYIETGGIAQYGYVSRIQGWRGSRRSMTRTIALPSRWSMEKLSNSLTSTPKLTRRCPSLRRFRPPKACLTRWCRRWVSCQHFRCYTSMLQAMELPLEAKTCDLIALDIPSLESMSKLVRKGVRFCTGLPLEVNQTKEAILSTTAIYTMQTRAYVPLHRGVHAGVSVYFRLWQW